MGVDYAAKCEVCGHESSEQPRDWGCGYCCPATAPEVPSREPGKFWRDGIYFPAGNADVVQMVSRKAESMPYVQVATFGYADVTHVNGSDH